MSDPRQRRYPWADLEAFATGRGWSVPELAAHAGKHRSEFHLWRREGSVPEYAADKVAVALGTTPDLIWGEAWAAVGLALAEAEEARRRAKVAKQKRRYRQNNPDYAERQRAKVEAWKDANPNRVRRYHADYQRAWRERQGEAYLAARREYQRAYRARREALREGGLQGGQNGQGKTEFRNYARDVKDARGSTSASPITSPITPIHTPPTSPQPIHSVTSLADNGTTEQEVA